MMASAKERNVFDERRADLGYLTHRQRLTKATSMVDHYPPWLQTGFILKVTNLTEGTQRLRRISKENKVLVQAINITNRTKGKTDTHLRPYVRYPKIHSSSMPVMVQLEKYNKIFHERLKNTPAVYGYWDLHRQWLRNKSLVRAQCRYPWDETRLTLLRLGRRWTIERMPTALQDFKRVTEMRPRVYLEFATSERSLGRIEVVLYRDVVPNTVNNFLSLIRGDGAEGLCYRNTPFFRVNPRLYAQGGDVVGRTGITNRSASGKNVIDERNFELQHSGPGVLSMCNPSWCNHQSERTVGSQFLITFRALRSLDGKNMVFGKMVRGRQTLYNIENLGTRSGKPKKEIFISSCGEVAQEHTNH